MRLFLVLMGVLVMGCHPELDVSHLQDGCVEDDDCEIVRGACREARCACMYTSILQANRLQYDDYLERSCVGPIIDLTDDCPGCPLAVEARCLESRCTSFCVANMFDGDPNNGTCQDFNASMGWP